MTTEDDLILAITDSEAEVHRAAGDHVEGELGHQYLVLKDYANLPHFSIRD